MVNSSEFSKRLGQIFDYYDLNAASFAEAIDVGRSSISHIISGRNKPSLDFVMKIVSTYPEVDLYWLLNGKGRFPKKIQQISQTHINLLICQKTFKIIPIPKIYFLVQPKLR